MPNLLYPEVEAEGSGVLWTWMMAAVVSGLPGAPPRNPKEKRRSCWVPWPLCGSNSGTGLCSSGTRPVPYEDRSLCAQSGGIRTYSRKGTTAACTSSKTSTRSWPRPTSAYTWTPGWYGQTCPPRRRKKRRKRRRPRTKRLRESQLRAHRRSWSTCKTAQAMRLQKCARH